MLSFPFHIIEQQKKFWKDQFIIVVSEIILNVLSWLDKINKITRDSDAFQGLSLFKNWVSNSNVVTTEATTAKDCLDNRTINSALTSAIIATILLYLKKQIKWSGIWI